MNLEQKYLIFGDFSLNLVDFYLLSMLIDWLTILNWETVMTSRPYHLERLKNSAGDQAISSMGIIWFSIQEPFGKELEVSCQRKT